MKIPATPFLLKNILLHEKKRDIGNGVEHSSQIFCPECSTRWPSTQYLRSILQVIYHLLPCGVFGRSRSPRNRDCLAARTRNRAISAALIFSSHCLKPPLFRHRTKKCLNRCEEAVVISRAWSLSPPRAGQSCPACALSFPAHRPDVPGKGEHRVDDR